MATIVKAPPGKCFETLVTIHLGDTDPYGVVYFTAYFRYFHQGIEEFFRHLGIPPEEIFRNKEKGFGLPIVHASCSFYRPVSYGETLRMAIHVLRFGDKALTFGFYFHPQEGDFVIAHGEVTMVSIDRSWQSRNLPDRLLDALALYLPPVRQP